MKGTNDREKLRENGGNDLVMMMDDEKKKKETKHVSLQLVLCVFGIILGESLGCSAADVSSTVFLHSIKLTYCLCLIHP